MGPTPYTNTLFQSSNTLHVRAAESSSGIPSMGGKPTKTPIIAGSVCGGVILIAWIVGFSIYFRKRYKRKQLKRAAAAIGVPPPDLKSRPQEEKVVIPPDPAVLLGQHGAGFAFAEDNHTQAIAPSDSTAGSAQDAEGMGAGQSTVDSGVGPGGSGHETRGERVEERRPLLAVVTDMSAMQRRHGADGEFGHGADARIR